MLIKPKIYYLKAIHFTAFIKHLVLVNKKIGEKNCSLCVYVSAFMLTDTNFDFNNVLVNVEMNIN